MASALQYPSAGCIDSHVHLTNVGSFPYSWMSGAQAHQGAFDSPVEVKPWTEQGLKAAAEAASVPLAGCVHIENTDGENMDGFVGEARWVLSLMRGDGDYGPGGPGASPSIIRGTVAHIPCSEGPEAVQTFADRMTSEESCSDGTLPAGLKGGREVLNGAAPDAGLVPAFVDAVQKVGELGLHWEICVSPAGFLNTPALVKQCPGTMFVVDHMGYCGKDFDS
jgi:predicted TIM-barrel fold metal-dependent hydrolase